VARFSTRYLSQLTADSGTRLQAPDGREWSEPGRGQHQILLFSKAEEPEVLPYLGLPASVIQIAMIVTVCKGHMADEPETLSLAMAKSPLVAEVVPDFGHGCPHWWPTKVPTPGLN
jgi:hypothetical protein